MRDEGGMERGGRVGEWEGESESERGREVGLGGREGRRGRGERGREPAPPGRCHVHVQRREAGPAGGSDAARGGGVGWGRGTRAALCDSDGDVTQMRAYPCIMASRLTPRHPFGLSPAWDHSSTLNPCRPGGGRGCAASGPGEPLTTPRPACARRRQAAGCRLLRRTRRLAHVAANSMLSAC